MAGQPTKAEWDQIQADLARIRAERDRLRQERNNERQANVALGRENDHLRQLNENLTNANHELRVKKLQADAGPSMIASSSLPSLPVGRPSLRDSPSQVPSTPQSNRQPSAPTSGSLPLQQTPAGNPQSGGRFSGNQPVQQTPRKQGTPPDDRSSQQPQQTISNLPVLNPFSNAPTSGPLQPSVQVSTQQQAQHFSTRLQDLFQKVQLWAVDHGHSSKYYNAIGDVLQHGPDGINNFLPKEDAIAFVQQVGLRPWLIRAFITRWLYKYCEAGKVMYLIDEPTRSRHEVIERNFHLFKGNSQQIGPALAGRSDFFRNTSISTPQLFQQWLDIVVPGLTRELVKLLRGLVLFGDERSTEQTKLQMIIRGYIMLSFQMALKPLQFTWAWPGYNCVINPTMEVVTEKDALFPYMDKVRLAIEPHVTSVGYTTSGVPVVTEYTKTKVVPQFKLPELDWSKLAARGDGPSSQGQPPKPGGKALKSANWRTGRPPA